MALYDFVCADCDHSFEVFSVGFIKAERQDARNAARAMCARSFRASSAEGPVPVPVPAAAHQWAVPLG